MNGSEDEVEIVTPSFHPNGSPGGTESPEVAETGASPVSLTNAPHCVGFTPPVPGPGVLNYPFALHGTETLPWDAQVKNGSVTLHAVYRPAPGAVASSACAGQVDQHGGTCQNCAALAFNTSLKGKLTSGSEVRKHVYQAQRN